MDLLVLKTYLFLKQYIMKNLLLTLLLPLFINSTPLEVEHDLIGIWHDEFNKESVQISRDYNFNIKFQRVKGHELKSKGLITESHDGLIDVERNYPKNEDYTLQYVFSPSKKTLVITKPNSNQAWVFTRIQ